ncbi:hypothetical protein [Nocardioides currus]|uniref:LppX_LprAFG lipoprotein n=1 Tax=Nocardioides currus TaxID=2133958 RepID=A0A2R7Z1U1_9ACTN|nr:hypothetical protein [Nocardioides currus]PUA82582.1 hypothetical protein C7S10_02270 [Nocardioides currus]
MARSSLARRLGAASLLTTLVLTSASCGGDTDSKATDASSSSDSSQSDDTTDETTDDTTEEASGDLEELSADEFYPAVMSAMQDAGSMAFSITTTGGPAATEMAGTMEYGDDGVQMQASSTGAQAMEIVLLDKTMYISGAGMPLPEGKTWLKVDLSDPDSLFGQIGKSTDPSFMFKAMEAPKEFELVGTEEIDGEPTNHYNVVMDTATYAEALELPAEVSKFMPKEIAMEMWVDGDNRPRQFRQELELPDMTGGSKTTKSVTEGKYFDFGTDVEIEEPPADEVADNVPGLS